MIAEFMGETQVRCPSKYVHSLVCIDVSVCLNAVSSSEYTNRLTHIRGIGRRCDFVLMSNHQNRHSSQTHRGISLLALSSGPSLATKLQHTYDA